MYAHARMQLPLRRLAQAILLLTAVVLAGAVGYAVLGDGRWTFAQALYMSVITISTVGFGELPGLHEVPGAVAVTIGIILGGIATVAYFQSTMTALLVEGTLGQAWRRKLMRKSIEALSNHVVVAGAGSTGRHAIEELFATHTPFIAVDRNRDHLQRLSEEVAGGTMLFVHGDATVDEVLKDAGVERASGVVAALADDKDNLFVTLSARSLNPKARIVARVIEPEAAAKMTRAGANAIVSPNMIGGRRMASELIRPEVNEFLDEMLRDKEKNLRLEEVEVAQGSVYAGHPLKDVPFRRETNVLVLAVRDRNRVFRYNPGPDHVLEEGTVLVVLGETLDMRKLRAMMDKRSAVAR
jgi:voltage-gated potassium channel